MRQQAKVETVVVSGKRALYTSGRIPSAPPLQVPRKVRTGKSRRAKDKAAPSVSATRTQVYRDDVSASTRNHWYAMQPQGKATSSDVIRMANTIRTLITRFV